MKSECAYSRPRMQRYLHGHLFVLQQRRIARHLASCPVCASEYDAVRRIDETQRLLRAVEAPEGMAALGYRGAALLAFGRRLLYRPLWLGLLLTLLAAFYVFGIVPFLHDPDLDRLDASIRSSAKGEDAVPQSAPAPKALPEPPRPGREAATPVSATTDPLIVTITVPRELEQERIRQINDAMKEHAMLRTMQFDDKDREISGSLTAKELRTFFNRIAAAGRVSYRRKRLASVAESELLPFVVRLRTAAPAPQPSKTPPVQPVDKAVEKPVEKAQEEQREKPVDKPVETPVGNPEETSGDRPASAVQPSQ